MIIVKHITDLKQLLKSYVNNGFTIGFVPTMGALHSGHISLINKAKDKEDLTVCSIFVNPTQFNNSTDFEKYPITIENDIKLLESAGCDLLFLPSVTEMYPPNDPIVEYDLGYIETILEGKYRPGHFQGVCRIVDKLLNAVNPNTLYLGQKDYQQCMVIQKMLELKNSNTHIEVCNTLRELDGLAMSSRNMRLSTTDRELAVEISRSLNAIKNNIKEGDVQALKEQAINHLSEKGFKVDYIEIADAKNLTPILNWNGNQKAVALVAAFMNEIRLIDNMLLN